MNSSYYYDQKDISMLNYINNYHLAMTQTRNTNTCIWHLFYPSNLRELILWYWFSNLLLFMLIDPITLHFCCNFTLDISSDGLFQKKSKHGPRNFMEFHGISWNFHSRGIEERARENPRVQLKKKWNLWGFYKEKLMWNFLGSWFLTLEFPISHNFSEFPWMKACFPYSL